MEKILYSKGLCDFEQTDKGFSVMHNEEKLVIGFDDINTIALESNLNAKTGAYIKLIIDTDNACLCFDSELDSFFDILDYINENMNTALDAVFTMSYSNNKESQIIYSKEK